MTSERPEEREAIRTTIVGGRPPGCGKDVGQIPRGIEILVKKASVDEQFKSLLLEKRAEAAGQIGLELEAAEEAMLSAIPAYQLEAIIDRTSVPQAKRPAFLGKVAAVMLAALGSAVAPGCGPEIPVTDGIRPDRIETENQTEPDDPKPDPAEPYTRGIRPDRIQRDDINSLRSGGSRPDMPMSKGIRPDRP